MNSPQLTPSQEKLLTLVHEFAPVTRRVIECACKQYGLALRDPEVVRKELGVLRGRGYVERYQTADSPRGVTDVIYLMTDRGSRAVLGSAEFARRQERRLEFERRRPGLGNTLPQLELILSFESPLCRVTNLIRTPYTAASYGRVRPDMEVTVQHRIRPDDPWMKRRVLIECVLESLSYAELRARWTAYDDLVRSFTTELRTTRDKGRSTRHDSAGAAFVLRTSKECDAFVEHTTGFGWNWTTTRGLISALQLHAASPQRTSGVYLLDAQRWSEVRRLRATGGAGDGRSVLVLRDPARIMRGILGIHPGG